MLFNVGDKVAWVSQAAASWKEKRGIVIAVLPVHRMDTGRQMSIKEGMDSFPGFKPLDPDASWGKNFHYPEGWLDLGELGEFTIGKYMGQGTSLADRYLVAVPRRLKSGKFSGSIDIYTPTQAVLQKNGTIVETI